ncbi:hypothetical protein EMN47_05115 [Prolixibacteraceae bacterium JC049]|nr:hypothetical protein [Prolixibacteraceae bacterium JC049]
MHTKYFSFKMTFFFIFVCSCTQITIIPLDPVATSKFHDLTLTPCYEVNDLRLDINRQKKWHLNEDEKENKEYHELGFDLGNGLFFDLNMNLSFRLDKLLPIPNDNYTVKHSLETPIINKTIIYQHHNDTVSIDFSKNKRQFYSHHIVRQANNTSVMYKKTPMCTISKKGDTISYIVNGFLHDQIIKKDTETYCSLNHNHSTQLLYKIRKNKIEIGNDYRIELTNNSKSIKIYERTPFSSSMNLIFTIEKDRNKTFVYTDFYLGYIIEQDGSNLKVTTTYKFNEFYQLIDHNK